MGWEEVAGLAASVADTALTIAVSGLDLRQTHDRLIAGEDSDVTGKATAWSGTVELLPPDYPDTMRVLTMRVEGVVGGQAVTVAADRGPAPQLHPHTPATLARSVHHLHQLAATLGELVETPAIKD